jgi:hypothetical protein
LRLNTEVPGGIAGEDRITDYDTVAKWVGRSWVCERAVGGLEGEEGGVRVRELGVEERLRREERDSVEDVDDGCRELWSGLWPTMGGDWIDEWRSVPLSDF